MNLYEPQQERPANVREKIMWDGECLTRIYVLVDSPQDAVPTLKDDVHLKSGHNRLADTIFGSEDGLGGSYS